MFISFMLLKKLNATEIVQAQKSLEEPGMFAFWISLLLTDTV